MVQQLVIEQVLRGLEADVVLQILVREDRPPRHQSQRLEDVGLACVGLAYEQVDLLTLDIQLTNRFEI